MVRHFYWYKQYMALRKALGIGEEVDGGYIVFEAVQWSRVNQKWSVG